MRGFATFEVLAGAYRGNGKRGMGPRSEVVTRSHLCELDDTCYPVRVCCRGVKIESICPDGFGSFSPARPTCPTCAKRWDRLKLKETTGLIP